MGTRRPCPNGRARHSRRHHRCLTSNRSAWKSSPHLRRCRYRLSRRLAQSRGRMMGYNHLHAHDRPPSTCPHAIAVRNYIRACASLPRDIAIRNLPSDMRARAPNEYASDGEGHMLKEAGRAAATPPYLGLASNAQSLQSPLCAVFARLCSCTNKCFDSESTLALAGPVVVT